MTPTHNGTPYRVIYTADGDLWARDIITTAIGANNGHPHQKEEMDAGATNQPHVVGGLATVPGTGQVETPGRRGDRPKRRRRIKAPVLASIGGAECITADQPGSVLR